MSNATAGKTTTVPPSEPARKAARQRRQPAAPRAGATPRRRPAPTILIVDDIADTRQLYSLYFSSRGYKVVTAPDGVTGIDAAERHLPDVVVMDLSMPGLDGIAATAQLKKSAGTRHLPVLILTGYPLQAAAHGALAAEADGFLTKPCLPEDLEVHVRKLLNPAKA